MEPTAGFTDQVTALFDKTVELIANACVCAGPSVTASGLTDMPTAETSVMVEATETVGSATLVAVKVTA